MYVLLNNKMGNPECLLSSVKNIFSHLSKQAMNEMNGKEIEGEEIEIVLAKPPDKKRKERQAARQASRSTAWVFISIGPNMAQGLASMLPTNKNSP